MHSETLGSILDFCLSSLSIPHPPVLLTQSPKWGKGQVSQHPASPTHTHTHTHPRGLKACVSLPCWSWHLPLRPRQRSQILALVQWESCQAASLSRDRTWGRKQESFHWHDPTYLSPRPLHIQVQLVPGAPGHSSERMEAPPLNSAPLGQVSGCERGLGCRPPPAAPQEAAQLTPHHPQGRIVKQSACAVCCPCLSHGCYFLQILTWHGITQGTSLTDNSPSHAEPLHDWQKI